MTVKYVHKCNWKVKTFARKIRTNTLNRMWIINSTVLFHEFHIDEQYSKNHACQSWLCHQFGYSIKISSMISACKWNEIIRWTLKSIVSRVHVILKWQQQPFEIWNTRNSEHRHKQKSERMKERKIRKKFYRPRLRPHRMDANTYTHT